MERLTASGMPVVTLLDDLPTRSRLAHVGVDDAAAGATAAYLIGQWLRREPGDVLVVVGSGSRADEDRELGFRKAMRRHHPERDMIGFDLDTDAWPN